VSNLHQSIIYRMTLKHGHKCKDPNYPNLSYYIKIYTITLFTARMNLGPRIVIHFLLDHHLFSHQPLICPTGTNVY